MRKNLFIIGLGLALFSCAPQKTVQQTKPTPKPVTETKPENVNKPPQTPKTPSTKTTVSSSDGLNFFKVNIADASKNDNTISHGSIVSAEPVGYTINRDYFPSLGQNFRQRYIILHYTALDDDRSVNVLTQQSVSSHYLVGTGNDKEIYQLVDENKRAYHSGISYWRKVENLNDSSIGIEIVNTGYTQGADGKREFYPYPEHQFRKVAALVKDLVTRYQIQPQNVLGHSDVAATRKQDPGPLFPWKRLYHEYGVGMWYDDATKERYLRMIDPEVFVMDSQNSTFIFKYQTMLNEFGYNIGPTGSNDSTTQKTIEAFQYRFRPDQADGVMDRDTYAILQALLEKYPAK